MSQQANEKPEKRSEADEERLETPESRSDDTERSESKEGYPTSGAPSSDTSAPDPS